ncbi:Psf2-domain-containing protein [Ascobolus immersus RN42]|uniref:DNA replication complex GINS protein PSF2 n=1 Tax=Ascobolus immersus RN42 TaxID=1160509 RepID=A0A3N4IHF9_ASCIM|nr:Psf2-domain-containing protein [Ascobolus immersus RN42]
MPPLHLISGTIPAMIPPQRISIPLWLALLLKKQKRCNIIPPDWMAYEHLELALKEENENAARFTDKLPYRWLEISELLLDGAADDFPQYGNNARRGEGDGGDIRVLLRGLREIRQAKARAGMNENLGGAYVQMTGLGLMEVTELKPYAISVMNDMQKLALPKDTRQERDDEDMEQDEDYDDEF